MATIFDVNAVVNCDVCSIAAPSVRTLFTCCDDTGELEAGAHANRAAMLVGFAHDEAHHVWLCPQCINKRPFGLVCALCGAEADEIADDWELGKHDPGIIVDICPLCLNDKPWGRTWLTDVAPNLTNLFSFIEYEEIEFPVDMDELTDGSFVGVFDSFEEFMSYAVDSTQQTYREAYDASSGAAEDLNPDDFA